MAAAAAAAKDYSKLPSAVKFQGMNSWMYVKNYMIGYLERKVDKPFFSKVTRYFIKYIFLFNFPANLLIDLLDDDDRL